MLSRWQVHVDTSSTTLIESVTPQVSKTNVNPFQCTYLFGNRHRTMKTISIQNAQIPIGFYNIRAPFNTLNISGTTYTIPPGNYTTLAQLNAVTFVNGTQFSSLGKFEALSPISNVVTFTSLGGTNRSLGPVTPNSLLSFLGYTQTTTTATAGTLVATNPYTLNWDTYINMWIENIGQSSLEPAQITFKIPLSTITSGVAYWSEGSQNIQKIYITDKSVRVDRLNITFLDRFGNILNNNGLDWSMSFDIESEN